MSHEFDRIRYILSSIKGYTFLMKKVWFFSAFIFAVSFSSKDDASNINSKRKKLSEDKDEIASFN